VSDANVKDGCAVVEETGGGEVAFAPAMVKGVALRMLFVPLALGPLKWWLKLSKAGAWLVKYLICLWCP